MEAAEGSKDAKFVTTLAYGIWDYAKLARRIREQTGVNRKALTPEKVNAIRYHLVQWLENNGYCQKSIHNAKANLNRKLRIKQLQKPADTYV